MRRFQRVLSAAAALCLGLCGCGDAATPGELTPIDTVTVPSVNSDAVTVPEDLTEGTQNVTVTVTEGTENCWALQNGVLTFSGLTEDTTCTLSGELDGAVVVDAGAYRLELELNGMILHSAVSAPLTIKSGEKCTITAKSDSENAIYDLRQAVTDEEEIASAVWSASDLDIQGHGALTVISNANNGIHSKDDLSVKNLSLTVRCCDNALKGNDSVTLSAVDATLVATDGDGIKTTATDLSEKGKQRGSVTVSGGKVAVYAAYDGIDAAWDACIGDGAAVTIQTGTGTEQKTDGSVLLRGGMTPPGGFPGGPGGGGGFGPGGPGGGGGFGPGGEGNSQKPEQSEKGIKAQNRILITDGTVTVEATDDALHADGEGSGESGTAFARDVEISGGTLQLSSGDDGIHAGNRVTVSGGNIHVLKSYEGVEGAAVIVSGGNLSVTASDDGINATATTGDGITVSGGEILVNAGGDGFDANTRTAWRGIVFTGGTTAVFSTSGGNSALDTEQGYTYTAGKVLAAGMSGGMSSESRNCQNFSSVATEKSMNLSAGSTLTVSDGSTPLLTVSLPVSMQASVVYLGCKGATIKS